MTQNKSRIYNIMFLDARVYEVCFEHNSDSRHTILAQCAADAAEDFVRLHNLKEGDWSIEVHYGTERRTFRVKIDTVPTITVVETTTTENEKLRAELSMYRDKV